MSAVITGGHDRWKPSRQAGPIR